MRTVKIGSDLRLGAGVGCGGGGVKVHPVNKLMIVRLRQLFSEYLVE